MPPFDLISLLSKKTKILIKCTTFIIHDWVNQLLYKTVGTIKYIVAFENFLRFQVQDKHNASFFSSMSRKKLPQSEYKNSENIWKITM